MVNERDLLIDVIDFFDNLENNELFMVNLEIEERERIVEGLQEMLEKREDGD